MPRSTPHPYLFLSRVCKQVFIPSGRWSFGFQSSSSHSSSLLLDLGYIVLSLHGSGKHVPCYTGSWWSLGRYTSQEGGFSVHPSEKQKSVAQQSQLSSKHISQIHAWLGNFLHSSISCLLTPFPPAWLLPPLQIAGLLLYYTRPHGRITQRSRSSCSLTTDCMAESLHHKRHAYCFTTNLMAESPSLSAHPYFKCSA